MFIDKIYIFKKDKNFKCSYMDVSQYVELDIKLAYKVENNV